MLSIFIYDNITTFSISFLQAPSAFKLLSANRNLYDKHFILKHYLMTIAFLFTSDRQFNFCYNQNVIWIGAKCLIT